jgi:hypothetical protein
MVIWKNGFKIGNFQYLTGQTGCQCFSMSLQDRMPQNWYQMHELKVSSNETFLYAFRSTSP